MIIDKISGPGTKIMADDNFGIFFMSLQTLPYIMVTIPIYYIVDKFVNKCKPSNREIEASNQREEYFQELVENSAKFEAEHAKEEEEFTRRIKKLEDECNNIRKRLDTKSSYEDTPDKLRKELNDLEKEQKKLTDLENELSYIDIRNIDEKLQSLESENKALSAAIETYKVYSPISERDSEVTKFLEAHDNDLSIEYLEKIYRTLLEIRATQSFDELKAFAQSNYAIKINDLRTKRLIVEKDLEKTQDRHKEELKKLSDARLQYILEVGYGRQYYENLRFLNDHMEAKAKEELEEQDNLTSQCNSPPIPTSFNSA